MKPKKPAPHPAGPKIGDAQFLLVGGVVVVVVVLLLIRLLWRRGKQIPPGQAAPLPEGSQLGHYSIRGLVADGGTATVYRATDPQGTVVAVKIPHADQLLDRDFVATFQREAEIGVDLKHPSIVRVIEAGNYKRGRFPKIPYFVMEYLEGQDLGQLIAQQGHMEPAAAAQIARSIADALDWAHHRGVVHRDISPRNVLITQKHLVKVMDFGISTVRSRTGRRAQQGKALNYGTPEYLAPERSGDVRSADERSDLYSLGCVFFEMLTGHPPYQADQPMDVIKMHRKLPIPRPSAEVQVPPKMEAIILKLLEKDPKKRYQKAAEVTSQLAELISTV